MTVKPFTLKEEETNRQTIISFSHKMTIKRVCVCVCVCVCLCVCVRERESPVA